MPSRESPLLFGISSSAVPAWDQRNGADQSDSRPDHMCDRHKSPSELVPSIVPRSTSIRRQRNSMSFNGNKAFDADERVIVRQHACEAELGDLPDKAVGPVSAEAR